MGYELAIFISFGKEDIDENLDPSHTTFNIQPC